MLDNTPENTPVAPDAMPGDGLLLDELLADLDAVTGMIERVRVAVKKGQPEVRLIPRGRVRTIEGALDELGDVLTRQTMQVRAQRAIRDGVADADLSARLDAAVGE